jgi:hypothetical protein
MHRPSRRVILRDPEFNTFKIRFSYERSCRLGVDSTSQWNRGENAFAAVCNELSSKYLFRENTGGTLADYDLFNEAN